MTSYYEIRTLGCKANLSDSQLIETELQARGWLPAGPGQEAELCIVNSCTVTHEAETHSQKSLKRLHQRHPKAKKIYTGCAAEVDPRSTFSRLAFTHGVLVNRDKRHLVPAALDWNPQDSSSLLGPSTVYGYQQLNAQHPMDREWPLPEQLFQSPRNIQRADDVTTASTSRRARAFLKIQEGCNVFCTYCIIPLGRGPSRSLAGSAVIEQIQTLVQEGVKEVVLTGTNIGDYGEREKDQPRGSGLFNLVQRIFKETTLPRLRLSSLDPVEISADLLALMEAEDRFCPHLHLSLQSPNSKILRLMKRQYRYEEVAAFFQRLDGIKRKIFLGMDLITGFPGEDQKEFASTLQVLQDFKHWSRLHVFPYSERQGTAATRLPSSFLVPIAQRRERSRQLNAISMERLSTVYHQRKLENPQWNDVLIEGNCSIPAALTSSYQGPWLSGYTPDYLRVAFPCPTEAHPSAFVQSTVSVLVEEIAVDRQAGDAMAIGRINEIVR